MPLFRFFFLKQLSSSFLNKFYEGAQHAKAEKKNAPAPGYVGWKMMGMERDSGGLFHPYFFLLWSLRHQENLGTLRDSPKL